MNNNHRITLNTNKNIIVEFTNERIIPASGLAVVGALLGKCKNAGICFDNNCLCHDRYGYKKI